MKRIYLAVLLFVFGANTVQAQSAEENYLNALDNWHDGHYPEALLAFQEILNGPDSTNFFEAIALQTGELYKVTELSEDGSNVRFSDDGKFALYDRVVDEKSSTFIHDISSGELYQKVEGRVVSVLGDGSVIYSQVEKNDELEKAAEKRDRGVREAREKGDRELWLKSLSEYALVEAKNTRLFLSNKAEGNVKDITPEGVILGEVKISPNEERIFFIGMKPGADYSNIYEYDINTANLKSLTESNNFESDLHINQDGGWLIFNYGSRNSISSAANAQPEFTQKTGILNTSNSKVNILDGRLMDISETDIALIHQTEDEISKLLITEIEGEHELREIFATTHPLIQPVISPDGSKIAFSMKEQDDYEVYVVDVENENLQRVSREIQHDRSPRFLNNNKVIAAKGEGRHQRSFMYDLNTGEVIKLFHNNTLRTIAPEYQWATNSTGDKLLIVSERDGDTISPERGVYLLNFNEKITKKQLLERIHQNLQDELALREKGKKLYQQIAEEVAEVVDKASVRRVYDYEKDLYAFDSKYISQPGNDKAAEYLFNMYKSFGYEPEYQWFTPAGREVHDGKTANVIATLKGTTNPELVYVVSSHYDSVERGPGADDNSSGTAALLEAARILADNPMPATIVFASFTGEEAGLLGSREFVRQAQENGMKIVGALNNDMVGMANDSRLDNTIRYSNPGIRDIQHAASFMFTDMVTYDALYYKFTDAHAYYEAYGDIVGGIGSYPVLGNPFYHQWNDNLETINHQLVTEVAKSTAATLMLLASSPSRVQKITAESVGENEVRVNWEQSPESGIEKYLIRYHTADGAEKTVSAESTKITLEDVNAEKIIKIKAVNGKGMEGWDWARISLN